MRVALASRIFAPEAAAAAFRLTSLAVALADSGADVVVHTVRPPRHLRTAGTPTGGGRRRLSVRRWPVLRDRQGYVRGYLQYMSFDIPLVARLLCSRRPDVVVAEPPPTTGSVVRLVSVLRRVPYVYYAADVWSDAAVSAGAPGPVVALLRRMESFALRGATEVVAISDGVADRVRALGGRRVTVIRNGIDTTVFRPEGPLAPEAPAGPYAVYAGTVSEWQGADVFVKAMAHVTEGVPGARLVFLGQGSAWQDLHELARSLPDGGACVEFRPVVPGPVAAAWLRGASAALASLRPGMGYDFAFPTKILAGAACGTPVLFAGPGPSREAVLDGGLGRAVDHDVDQVAVALADMLRRAPDPAERRARARWVEDNASASATGGAVARLVRAAGQRPARSS